MKTYLQRGCLAGALLLLPIVPACVSPELQQQKIEAEAREGRVTADLASIRNSIAKAQIQGQDSTELQKQLAEKQDELKKADADLKAVKDQISEQRRASGVQIAQWATGALQTGAGFTLWGVVAGPLIGALGSLVAGFIGGKKNAAAATV